MVQRHSARRILHDFSSTSNASALVAQLQLENLPSRRTSDRVNMMYTIINGLVDVDSAALLEPSNRRSRGHQAKLQIPHSRTYARSFFPSSIRLWNDVPVIPCKCIINYIPTFIQVYTEGMDGAPHVIIKKIIDIFFYQFSTFYIMIIVFNFFHVTFILLPFNQWKMLTPHVIPHLEFMPRYSGHLQYDKERTKERKKKRKKKRILHIFQMLAKTVPFCNGCTGDNIIANK